jgi:hypothetical protein
MRLIPRFPRSAVVEDRLRQSSGGAKSGLGNRQRQRTHRGGWRQKPGTSSLGMTRTIFRSHPSPKGILSFAIAEYAFRSAAPTACYPAPPFNARVLGPTKAFYDRDTQIVQTSLRGREAVR